MGAPARRARASVAPAATPPDTDCAAAIKSHRTNTEKGHDSDDDPRTPRTGEQDYSKKRVNFKNPIGVSSYLAASGDGGALIIGIGDIDLAGEKHLSVAVRASMAAGWTGVRLRRYQWRERRRRWTKRRWIVFSLDFYRVYLLFRCAVKSIAEDSSEIEHTRRQKRQLPLGVSSAGSPPFYPLRRVYSGAIRWSRFFGSRRRLVILFFSFPCLRQ